MNTLPEGNAIVYCENAFNTPNGKTAHGLVRFTERYQVLSVIDSKYAGQDAGKVLDNKENGIPIYSNLKEAFEAAVNAKKNPTHFVIGLAPDGGRLPESTKDVVKSALKKKLNVDSGLHDFLSEDKELKSLAAHNEVTIRDIRKTPSRNELHFFSGKIEEVNSMVIAVLGTDSAIGKRTTAWMIVHALRNAGYKAELIGTGQTAWMQGAKYSIILDSLINDFVSGEIEHAVHSAWKNEKPNFIVLEGQGSLLNPAYPGGFELLAAGRPDVVILQHAPARKEYDGFPDYTIHPLSKQIKAVEVISGKRVIAVTINHENMTLKEVNKVCEEYLKLYELPAFDVLWHGADKLVKTILKFKK
ncbi:MAG: DUF1611 domain-containing protein [Ignavibacteriales bacterium]|nr:DUF1611 domain-containing protein [Ignavibacteriales bacterium]MCB9259172.1 DUF1611 domain-containing protein [Ignavibacteriales bacterium]